MPDLCFVMMPFGEKVNESNMKIDFDIVYQQLITPAILAAKLKPIRDDEKKLGGLIIKTMFERIIFCDFAIADITYDNPNVFYELGIRHAVRPFTTIIISEKTYSNLPFDVSPVRVIYYEYDFINKTVAGCKEKVKELSELLLDCKTYAGDPEPDSPIKQLFSEFDFPEVNKYINASKDFESWISHLQGAIQTVEDLVNRWKQLNVQFHNEKDPLRKEEIKLLEQKKIDEIKSKEELIRDNPLEKYALLLTITKAYRDTNSIELLVSLLESIQPERREIYPELEERLAHAYKISGKYDEAENIVEKLLLSGKHNQRPALNSLLGSIYKHKSESLKEKNPDFSDYLLKKAIEKYRESFDDNPNEYYPGICLLNLLYTSGSEEHITLFNKYFPLVEYSIDRRLKKTNEFWGYAARIELETLRDNKEKVKENIYPALSSPHAPWKREATARHLKRIADYKEKKGEKDTSWIHGIINKLTDFTN